MKNEVASHHVEAGQVPKHGRALLARCERLRAGQLDVLAPRGERFSFAGSLPGPKAVLELEDWDTCAAVLARGALGWAETYLSGRWNTPDLAAVLTLAALNRPLFESAEYAPCPRQRLLRLGAWLRSGVSSHRPLNVHTQYELGPDFYQRWLDPTMTYSGALFEGDFQRSLEQAQLAKYDRVLTLLDPRPGGLVLDLGCGWGGFAQHAARSRECHVRAVTISRRQAEFVRRRVEQAGLAERVQVELGDYRAVRGRFDHVVSIEMVETLGEHCWPSYFRTVADRLAPEGSAVVQAITVSDERFPRYRRSSDFIQQFIAPRRMLGSQRVLQAQMLRAGLVVRSSNHFGPDYAETLRRWKLRFDQAWPELRSHGFDARFKRLWSFYLCYCEAGFRARDTDVSQMLIMHV